MKHSSDSPKAKKVSNNRAQLALTASSALATEQTMAAEIARQVLTTHLDDDEDTFNYVLALALDGEDVTPFLVEACDDDEEAAAALAVKLTDALRLAGHITDEFRELGLAPRARLDEGLA